MPVEGSLRRENFFWTVNFVFTVAWTFLAFNVVSRADWALENALVFILIPVAVISFLKGHLSQTSYFQIFAFTLLHIVGAHYTYSLVPYDKWTLDIFGWSLNEMLGWERNNYDRILHFFAGVFLFHPLRELFGKTTTFKGKPLVLFTILVIIAASTLYELIEFGAAIVFGGDLGIAYVGAQGDIWDAQKDQVLAILGISIGLAISWLVQLEWSKKWIPKILIDESDVVPFKNWHNYLKRGRGT